MKLIRMSLGRIGGSMRSNRLTFTLFFLGAVISSFVFIYFYGNALKVNIAVTENSEDYRLYEVEFSENTPVTTQQLHALDNYGVTEVQVSCKVTLPEEDQKKLPDATKMELFTFRDNMEAMGEGLFTQEQLGQDGVLIDKTYGYGRAEISVDGMSFPVVGTIDNGMGGIRIPFDSYMKHFGKATHVMILLNTVLPQKEIAEATQRLQKTFPQASGYLAPDYSMKTDQKEQTQEVVGAGLLYMVSLLCFLFLFKYLLDQNRGENVICRMVGARRGTLFRMVLLEVGILALAASALACLVHVLFYDSVFHKLNMTTAWISYSVGDYLLVLAVTVALALVTALPFSISCLRNTPVELKSRYNA